MIIDGSEVISCGTCSSLVIANDYRRHQQWHGRQTDMIEHLVSAVESLTKAMGAINVYSIRSSADQ